MYAVSEAFHTAVLNGSKQKAMLMFSDTLLTNSNIAMNGGIVFTDPFCSKSELIIGLAPSSYIDVSVINDKKQFDSFSFGEFSASLGVNVSSGTYTPTAGAIACVDLDGDIYSIHDSSPYVRRNGSGLTKQPEFIPASIIYWGGYLYVISATGVYYRYGNGLTHDGLNEYTHTELAAFTHEYLGSVIEYGNEYAVNDVMTYNGLLWAANNTAFVYRDNEYTEYDIDGSYDLYEMCPLGIFNADRPATTRKIIIKFSAFDNMEKFNIDITDWFSSLTYPLTLGEMYAALCAQIGISTTTTTFINSTYTYTSAPFTSTSLTGKQLLKYIAEAACSIARCDRDGYLELAWFGSVSHEINEFINFSPSEYEVPIINNVQVQAETTEDVAFISSVTEGDNTYVLLANPLFVGNNEADLSIFGNPIASRLFTFNAFTPININVVADWSLQGGDIITVRYSEYTDTPEATWEDWSAYEWGELSGVPWSSEIMFYDMPIYSIVIKWNGVARANISNTGLSARDTTSVPNRQQFSNSQTQRIGMISADRIDVDNLWVKHLDAAEGDFDQLDLADPEETFLGMRLGQFARGVGYASGIRWNLDNAYEWGLFQDEYGNPTLSTQDYFYLYSAIYTYFITPMLDISNSVYIGDNCSAESFTDRTRGYSGDALAAIAKISNNKNGDIDHSSLPPEARKRISVKPKGIRGRNIRIETEGRDLGAMISILTKAVQQLSDIVKEQQKQLDSLKKERI